MRPDEPDGVRLGRVAPRGKATFEWAIAFAAVSLLFPISALIGVALALDTRRRGYSRWPAALVMALWCGVLGAVLRGMLKMGVVP